FSPGARWNRDDTRTVCRVRVRDSTQRDLDHEAVEPFVRDEDVASAPEHEYRKIVRSGVLERPRDLCFRFGTRKKARWTTDLQSRQRRQRNVMLNVDGIRRGHIPKYRTRPTRAVVRR